MSSSAHERQRKKKNKPIDKSLVGVESQTLGELTVFFACTHTYFIGTKGGKLLRLFGVSSL